MHAIPDLFAVPLFYSDILSVCHCHIHIARDGDIDVGVADMEDITSVFGDDDGNTMTCMLGQFHLHENPHQHVVSWSADALKEHLLGLSFGKTAVRQYLDSVLEDGDKGLREVPIIVDERVDESLIHAIEVEEVFVGSRAAGGVRHADVLGDQAVLHLFVGEEKRLRAIVVSLGNGGFVLALELDDKQWNGVLVGQQLGQQVVFPLWCL